MHIGVHNVDYTPPKKWEPIPPKLQSLYCLIFHILLSWACLTFPQIVTTSTFFPFSRYWKGEQLMGAQIWWVFNLFLWRFKGETLMSFPSSKKVNTEKEQLEPTCRIWKEGFPFQNGLIFVFSCQIFHSWAACRNYLASYPPPVTVGSEGV